MPLRTGVPRTTHQWLQPLYRYLDAVIKGQVPSGASGVVTGLLLGGGVPVTQIGNPTGIIGLYGSSGVAGELATGGQFTGGGASFATFSGIGGTGIGGSGLISALSQIGFNGGTGTMFTLNDIVKTLKNLGAIPQ